MLVVAGSRAAWPPARRLPGVSATLSIVRGGGGRLSGLEYGHAVFAPFRAPRSGDFSAARFFGYRRLDPARTRGARPLRRRHSRRSSSGVGRGRVLVWTRRSTFWNDLALKPVFLPFVHQLVRTLAAYHEKPSSITVGQVAAPGRGPDAGRPRVAWNPAGRTSAGPTSGDALAVTVPGFYEVRPMVGRRPPNLVAANVDLAESDVAAMDPADDCDRGGCRQRGWGGRHRLPRSCPTRPKNSANAWWWYLLFAGCSY